MIDNRVERVSRALHTFHGQGYCSMGKHNAGQNYLCFDEARAILDALDGGETSDIPNVRDKLTLSARMAARGKK